MSTKIRKWLNQHKDEATDFLQKLVQEGSEQGNEFGVQQLVKKQLERLGLDVDYWIPDGDELINHRYFCATRTDFSKSPNVVGTWKGDGGGKSLVLNGHIDVVPPGDLKQWEHPPYSGYIEDGKMFGRGVTDMKGGNLALLLAIQCLKELNVSLKGDVLFHSVIEEESGGAGTLAAVLRGHTADAALVPEPTNMKIFPKQQGSIWFRLTVNGMSAHGGTRYEGVSAIEKSVHVIQAIQKLEYERNNRVEDPLYQNTPIPLPINIGKIEGGNWPSSVPDEVFIEGRIGVGPNESLESVKEEFEYAMCKIEDNWLQQHPVQVEWFGAQWLPGSIDLEHELMGILQKKYEEVVGEPAVIEASPWGTDGGLLTQVGNTPSIVFGPGVTAYAHYPNEYIELEKVFQAAEIFSLIIYEWCEGEGL
ncbi:peptidase [Pseudalkalibacillus berkeleyi]|uniref:Peptidase n=1 Tax=Pseudalkalibacillus berkeleyi TaxID=1069813 RepID=A0ABS9H0F8_9BACL|nr:peptidase [Pseudalkalibacillus berkeleyi]MCF6137272.1 peptidase [Pseudalkalibacillus berkeleyi]